MPSSHSFWSAPPSGSRAGGAGQALILRVELREPPFAAPPSAMPGVGREMLFGPGIRSTVDRTEPLREPDEQLSVYIVDDDAFMRRALARVLRSAGHEVRTFSSARQFLENWKPPGPGCLVLDLRLPDVDGIELYGRLQLEGAVPPTIFLTGFGDIPTSVRAMKSGAIDFLAKPVEDETLLRAVAAALEQEHRSRLQRMQSVEVARRYASLTPREREVMQLVLAGLLNKQIARELQISEKTVKVHRGHMMTKMGVKRAAQLAQLAASTTVPPAMEEPS